MHCIRGLFVTPLVFVMAGIHLACDLTMHVYGKMFTVEHAVGCLPPKWILSVRHDGLWGITAKVLSKVRSQILNVYLLNNGLSFLHSKLYNYEKDALHTVHSYVIC